MKLLRRIVGLDFPDPEVGQIWRCGHNGELMRVEEVRVTRRGSVHVSCSDWLPAGDRRGRGPGWGMPYTYAWSLSGWRTELYSERRLLLQACHSGVATTPCALANPIPQPEPNRRTWS